MKIFLMDPYNKKFTADMIEWWEAHGHSVTFSQYYNPDLVPEADIVWFDTADNNAASATNPDSALKDEWAYETKKGKWDMHDMDLAGKKIVVRPIDIECWGGSHANIKWDIITHCIFIAPHIKDIVMADSRPQASDMQIFTIPHSVNPDKWTFKQRRPGNKIAIVAEIWESKGIDYVLQIAYKLKDTDYEFHYLGKEQDYHWHRHYRKEFIEKNKLKITFYDWVDNLDEWLEDKNYLLHSSTKEAFSAATAEAAAKGLKPLLHAFGGYEPLWGDSGWVWQGIDGAIDMILGGEYDSNSYRDYLYQKGYVTDIMMGKIMDAINA